MRVKLSLISAVIAVVGIVAGTGYLSQALSGSSTSAAAPTVAREPISPAELPHRLMAIAEQSFGPEIGQESVRHLLIADAFQQPLSRESYERASFAGIDYVSADHILSLNMHRSPAESEGISADTCREGVEIGKYLECSVEKVDGGIIIIKTKSLTFEFDSSRAIVRSTIVSPEDHAADTLPTFAVAGPLWIKRSVEFIASNSYQVTSASESVLASNLTEGRKAMRVEIEKLSALAQDQHLVLAEPKP